MEIKKKASKDESFKRPGSIPFKWEIQPGIPKPHRPTAATAQKQLPKLSPPPSYIGKQSPLPRQAPPVSQGCFPPPSHIGKQSPLPRPRPHPRPPPFVSQGCFPVQSIRRKEASSTSSPRRSISARYSSPFSLSFSKSRAKEELEMAAQWMF